MLHVWSNYTKDEFYEPRLILFGVWNSCVCVLLFVREIGLGSFTDRRPNHDDRGMVDLGRMRSHDAE
jgi:hypothetical protein